MPGTIIGRLVFAPPPAYLGHQNLEYATAAKWDNVCLPSVLPCFISPQAAEGFFPVSHCN